MPSRWRQIAVAVTLLGVYTNYAANVGPFRIYAAPAVVCGILLLVSHRPRPSFYAGLATVAGLFVLVVALSAPTDSRGFTTAVQLMASLSAMCGVALELRTWDTERLRSWARFCVVAVCVVGILEPRLSAVRELSDSFRERAYGGLFLYVDDARDLALHGIVRPKVFTQEPSHPARFIGAMIVVWCVLTPQKRQRLLILVGAVAVGMFALRSPSLVVCVPLVAYSIYRDRAKPGRTTRKLSRAAFTLATVVGVLTASAWIGWVPSARTAAIASGNDTSSIIRLDVPTAATELVLDRSPLFGLGMASGRASELAIREAAYQYPSVSTGTVDALALQGWGNGFLHLWAHMGLLGGGAFVLWFGWFVRRHLGWVDLGAVALAFAVNFSVEGSYPLFRPWFYAALAAIALNKTRGAVPGRDADAHPAVIGVPVTV